MNSKNSHESVKFILTGAFPIWISIFKIPPPLLNCLGFSFDPYWRIDEFILFLWMFCIKLSSMYFGLDNIRDFCFCVTLGIFTFVAFKFDTL